MQFEVVDLRWPLPLLIQNLDFGIGAEEIFEATVGRVARAGLC